MAAGSDHRIVSHGEMMFTLAIEVLISSALLCADAHK